MALSQQQIDILRNSMESYTFPAVYFNCDSQPESQDLTMADVELRIKQDLISEKISDVRREYLKYFFGCSF